MVTKRNGKEELFDAVKIARAVQKAYRNVGYDITTAKSKAIKIAAAVPTSLTTVEDIQDVVERLLFMENDFEVAKAFILYRADRAEEREIDSMLKYMDDYADATNAATASNTDPNANSRVSNVASMEGEVNKKKHRKVQRRRMFKKLKEMYGEDVAEQYLRDLHNHIIYTHDEASTVALKPYCSAVSLYPLILDGVGAMDGITPKAPESIASFSGQLVNLIFALSAQCKGAVAVSEYFIMLNYYINMEYGEQWYLGLDKVITTSNCVKQLTIKDAIHSAFKQFVWGINQPQGNRGYQSPFTNVAYFDKEYFHSMFENFYYPNGTKPKWDAIFNLQKLFMEFLNDLRLKEPVAFPVETYALLYDEETKKFKDEDSINLCSEMLAKGHSFFSYINSNASSLSSCCRLNNEIAENTFNPTSGLTGVMTGSCNVITLNINRIVQEYCKKSSFIMKEFQAYLKAILQNVYQYHIAYKTMLYEIEEKGMLASSNAGYITMNKLYSTIGFIGYAEAALFLGLEVGNNDAYKQFLVDIVSTLKESNAEASIRDSKRPFIFNSEAIPGESLAVKFYNWDKEDGYVVPEDRNLYDSYFYNPHSNDTTIFDKMILHGEDIASHCDGGQACHINLDAHLSKAQYLMLYAFAATHGTHYFTYNIPNTKCEDCGHIVKAPVTECPKCHHKNLTYYTRIVGYLSPMKSWEKARQVEGEKRVYAKPNELLIC